MNSKKFTVGKLAALAVIIAGVFWGSSCLFVNVLSKDYGFTSIQSTAIRELFAALMLNIALIIKGRGFKYYKISLGSYALAAVTGVFCVLAMSVLYYSCMIETSAAVAVILLYTAPIFVMIMSLIFFKERLTVKKVIAFIFAIVGCALVSGILSGSKMSLWGIFVGVLSGFSYSLYGIMASAFMKKNDEPLTFSALSFLFASVVAVCISAPWEIVSKTAERGTPVLSIIFFMLFGFCTAVAPFALYTWGLSGVKPVTASILAFSEPVTGCIFGVVALGQDIDAFGILGIISVCFAILILNISFKGKKTRKES